MKAYPVQASQALKPPHTPLQKKKVRGRAVEL